MITEQEILNKYPKIFRDKDKSPQETCMCWGLEVPDDWLPIIDSLCNAMTHCGFCYNNEDGRVDMPQVVADQVKSKWNQLRFYYYLEYSENNKANEQDKLRHRTYFDGMIAYAENMIYQLEKLKKKK
jgi:hypothetical protein